MEQRLQKDINQQQQQQQQQQRVPQDQHTEGNRYMRKKVETKLEARSPVSKQARPKTPFNAQKRNVEDMTQGLTICSIYMRICGYPESISAEPALIHRRRASVAKAITPERGAI
jgi:hypothetical protein